MNTAQALQQTLISPNVADSNLEAANVVDVVHQVACGCSAIANAIAPSDRFGGDISSLTEAVMGLANGAAAIATAIDHLASAVADHQRTAGERQ